MACARIETELFSREGDMKRNQDFFKLLISILIPIFSPCLLPSLLEAQSEALSFKILYTCADPTAPTVTNICVIDANGANPQILVKDGVSSNAIWSSTVPEIYFAHDQGPATYRPEGIPDSMPPFTIPMNTDLYSMSWTTGDVSLLSDRLEIEAPLQALPTADEILISKSAFVRQTTGLTDRNHKLEVQFKLINLPCLFSLTSKECRVLGSENSESPCPPIPLPQPAGLSPDGTWMTVPALLCASADAVGTDESSREPGLLVLNRTSGAANSLFQKDLGPCQVFDGNGGRAVELDGVPTSLKFDPAAVNTADCRLFLSYDRQQFAFFSADGQVFAASRDGTGAKVLVPSAIPGVDRLAWAADGSALLAFSSAGGPMVVVSTTELGKVTPLGAGKDPSWSLAPLPNTSHSSQAIVKVETPSIVTPKSKESAKPAASSGCNLLP